jgi:hypothetical protein
MSPDDDDNITFDATILYGVGKDFSGLCYACLPTEAGNTLDNLSRPLG